MKIKELRILSSEKPLAECVSSDVWLLKQIDETNSSGQSSIVQISWDEGDKNHFK